MEESFDLWAGQRKSRENALMKKALSFRGASRCFYQVEYLKATASRPRFI